MKLRNSIYRSPDDGGAGGGAGDGGASGDAGGGGERHSPGPFAGISDEYRGGIEAGGYKTLDDFAKSHLELQKTLGADKIVLPGQNASADELNMFYGKLGRPDDATGYEFKGTEDGEATETDMALQEALRPAMHKAGVTQGQLDILTEAFNGFTGSLADQRTAQTVTEMEAASVALNKEFGAETDAKLALANTAIRVLGNADLVAELEKSGFGRNPEMVKVFARVGEALAGDLDLIGAGQQGAGFASTPDAAKAEIQKISDAAGKDPKHPYINSSHPEHKQMKAKMMRLNAVAYPG